MSFNKKLGSPAAGSGIGTGISAGDPRYWCKISWGSTEAADEVEIAKLWMAKGSGAPENRL